MRGDVFGLVILVVSFAVFWSCNFGDIYGPYTPLEAIYASNPDDIPFL